MLASGNDAANAIAFYLSGSLEDFCALMNKRAAEIGMQNTHFATPSGLDRGDHHSSAYDMALLAAEAMKNSDFASVAGLKSDIITVNNTKKSLYNHNKLLSMDTAFSGIKTGYTKKAGRCLVSSYDYQGRRIIIVTLNDPDDWNDHIRLSEYACSFYKRYFESNTITVDTVSVDKPKIECEYIYDTFALDIVRIKLYYYPIVYPPLKAGEVIGYAEVYSEDVLLCVTDIVSKEDV